MSGAAPRVDARSASDIAARLVALLEQYTVHPQEPAQRYPFAGWQEFDAASGAPLGRSAALIGVFARFAEIVIERLNRVPDKNFLAFLDLLGASRQAPRPARAPLTFSLASGAALDAEVPAGTQVAAPPGPGEKDPVVFETERPLTVTAAQITSLLTVDPGQDSYGDWSERLALPSPFTVFEGDRAFEHVLYIGDGKLFGYERITSLRLEITLDSALPQDAEPRVLKWERWDGAQWQGLAPVSDATDSLTRSGTIDLGAVPPLPEAAVNGRTSRWLRCRLLTPVTAAAVPVAGMVRDSRLPRIARIAVAADVVLGAEQGSAADLGFVNGSPLDLTRDFFPFGDQPRVQDALFLASAEAFSKDRTASESDSGARIDLDVRLANSHLQPGPGSVRGSADLELAWECWTGSGWQKLGASPVPPWLALLELEAPSLVTENGVTSAILQGLAPGASQVTSANLGTSAETRYLAIGPGGRFADKRALAAGVNVFELAALAGNRSGKSWVAVQNGPSTVELALTVPTDPVEAASISLSVTLSGTEAASIATVKITSGSSGAQASAAPGQPIAVALSEGRNELLVEALTSSGERKAARAITLSRSAAAPAPDAQAFSDGTFAFSQSGVVTLQLPDTVTPTAVNGQESFWLRVRIVKGDYGKDAGYVLVNPVKPEEGFTLVPATFRPPLVAALKIGYEITPRRAPEVCLSYNELAFEDRTAAAAGGAAAFTPFSGVSESDRPRLYVGFSLPAGRASFPGTAISLYAGIAGPRYGERAVPLFPESTAQAAEAGSRVTHVFTLTNASAHAEDFDVALLGYRWASSATASVSLGAGAAQELAIRVDVPLDAASGETDSGLVRVIARSDPQRIHGAVFTTRVGVPTSPERPVVAWSYWNGARWVRLAVQDDSENLTRSGVIEFIPPADLEPRALFGSERFWLCAQWDKGAYPAAPRLARLALNTTLARQATTLVNEILGSSDGTERQQFASTRSPVLAGQQLEVREPELPAAEDRAALEREEGADAVTVVADATGRPREIWVRWHEVPDFYGSGPRDRHYVMDHLTGEVLFGDGINGRIAPRGSGNVRLARYQTGGGERGNCAAGALAQLKTTVPYVAGVINPEPASGGAEAEPAERLVERMPRTLRHRDRAVTLEDYEDLAVLASPEVARTRCVPLRDLAANPTGDALLAGAVSVVIVPRTGDGKPLPTLELLSQVRDFLTVRSPVTATVTVVGPLYVRVDVRAELALSSADGASAVERAVRERLAAFLHPLTGGLDGTGWDFGRAPHRSDFFALIESIPGVDHVRFLQITETEDRPGVRATDRFLVFSGEHRIDLVLDD